jgi:hypothetical protein
MRMTLQRASLLVTLAALLFAADKARAQEDPPPHEYWQRLRSPARVRGLIGGESHDSYVIHARKGQIMNVRISWRLEPFDDQKYDTNAQFSVSGWPIFSGDHQIKGAKESNNGTRWTAKIPKTGNYYIFVTGYPAVRYIVRVTVE